MSAAVREDLAATLVAASARLVRLVGAEADLPFSTAQSRVLALLRDSGPLRVTELARREHCSQPAMTTLVDRLEHAGLVARTPDPADRRATLVSVTERGRDRLREARVAMAAALAPRLDRLTAAEREQLGACTEILAGLMEDR